MAHSEPDVAVEGLPIGCAAAFAKPMTIKAGANGDKSNILGGVLLNGFLIGSVELGYEGVDVCAKDVAKARPAENTKGVECYTNRRSN